MALAAGIFWGPKVGAGFLLGFLGVFFSLLVLRFALFRTLGQIKNPKAAGQATVLAWLIKLPVTLALLSAGALLAKPRFIAWSFAIVLVYFAVVFGAFYERTGRSKAIK